MILMTSEVGLAISILEPILRRLPNILLKRLYSISKFQKELIIETRSVNPIDFCLGTYVPCLNIWLTLTNQSIFDLQLQELFIDVWLSQPLVKTFTTERPLLKSRKQVNVHCMEILNQLQVNRIREWRDRIKESPNETNPNTLYVTARFKSKIGILEIKKLTLENRSVKITG